MKLFLGGTCNDSIWREDLIPMLEDSDIDYFNPVVGNWDLKAQEEKIRQKNECEGHLYVISKEMTGVFSIAEAVESVMVSEKKCFFMVLLDGFDSSQVKSLQATVELIHRHGGCVCSAKEGPQKFSWLVSQILEFSKEEKVNSFFEVGKFYRHINGRCISVVGSVDTRKWGKSFVMEETDPTGHGISCCSIDDKDESGNWVEISEHDFGKAFITTNICLDCELLIEPGDRYRSTPRGLIHEKCFEKLIAEGNVDEQG